MKIQITNHAINRWRERVAVFGDETIAGLVDRFQKAVRLQGEPPKGLAHYRDENVLFVVHTDHWKTTVITVIDETPKKIETFVELEYNADDDETILATWTDVNSKRIWLKAELKVLEKDKSSHAAAKRRWIEKKLGETKAEWEQIRFLQKVALESERRQKEKDDEWEQWYAEQRAKNQN